MSRRAAYSHPRRRLTTLAGLFLLAAASCDAPREVVPPRADGAAAAESGDPLERDETGLSVLVIGIDGATFDVLDPLLAAGDAPHFARLIDRGSRSILLSEPPGVSPVYWTTIATGRPKEQHGIRGFIEPTDDGSVRLVSAADRRVPALWSIASQAGLSAGVVGWWVTWPAEPIDGFVVSDRVALGRHVVWRDGRVQDRLTWPVQLAADIAPWICDPLDPPLDEILSIAPLDEGERAEMMRFDRPVKRHWLSVLRFGWCEQRTYEEIAIHLLARRQPRLAMLLLIAVDPISHNFWHFYQPEAFADVDPERAQRLGVAIPNAYRHDDATIGRLLETVSDDTVVFVVSDHGFGPRRDGRLAADADTAARRRLGDSDVEVGFSGTHRPEGILIAAGGPIRSGAPVVTIPTIADIAPTILVLLGLPVADDMHGRVLEEWIDPAFLARHPVRRIPSYDPLVDRADLQVPDGDDAARRDYLRSLGYVD